MSRLPRILIVGHAGQVGVELQRSFAGAGEIICHDRDSVDLAVPDQVRAMVRTAAPEIILNAAAYTAVDRAEAEQEAAFAVNATAPGILAEEALRRDALLVHYSTDYVFDGSKTSPWVETDVANPLNVYGASKLAGEKVIQQVGGKYLIFRTSWVYGPCGNNFLLTMLRLARERESLSIVDDQVGAPTSSIELAKATRTIADGALAGQFGAASTT
jgi:dTDP-4-dehydrorhamnose reductase